MPVFSCHEACQQENDCSGEYTTGNIKNHIDRITCP